jgi:alkyl sulfatase BDS1-like metallo-beta-lactamase superfamily hydrolase
MAENCTHNMHNLYPIRGAQTRDALAWSKYINEALDLWGNESEIMIATHHWPRFGTTDLKKFLVKQRDVYRWMHDQTMRLANLGWKPNEIAEKLKLPDCFSTESHVQGYYGTVSHNVKSVYNKYLGWYDANPANLNPHPPTQSSRLYVEFMGGADSVLRQARSYFEEGDYRWVAEVVNHVVFADPSNQEARELQADALEQLGYQSESGTWRNAYLYGALELRSGSPDFIAGRGRQIAHAMTAEQLFDSMGVRLDSALLEGLDLSINWKFTDLDETHVLGISNSAVHHLDRKSVV